MKIASLGSGSKGNATLVASGDTTILIDCGFSLKKIEAKADDFGLALANITAIFVTHEHGDHISGVAKLANKYNIPVYITLGTSQKIIDSIDRSLLHTIYGGQSIDIEGISIQAVTVPHDCLEPVQFVFTCLQTTKTLGVLTDVGHISSHVVNAYSNLDALLLEFNYDRAMLDAGPYPHSLKQRVSSNYGHLSNEQSIELLRAINCQNMKTLIIGHISEKNNHPDIISSLLLQEPNLPQPLYATQSNGFSWVML